MKGMIEETAKWVQLVVVVVGMSFLLYDRAASRGALNAQAEAQAEEIAELADVMKDVQLSVGRVEGAWNAVQTDLALLRSDLTHLEKRHEEHVGDLKNRVLTTERRFQTELRFTGRDRDKLNFLEKVVGVKFDGGS